MLSTTFLTCALIAMTLNRVKCDVCADHPKPCSSLSELAEEEHVFEAWGNKMCPTNTTVLDKAEIDKYKNCLKTLLEPCLQEKEDAGFKKIFIELFDKYDLVHVCSHDTQQKIEDDLIHIVSEHKDEMEKRAGVKCSTIKQAMYDVMKCAGI